MKLGGAPISKGKALGTRLGKKKIILIVFNWYQARFSKLPVITVPVKLFCFPFYREVLKV